MSEFRFKLIEDQIRLLKVMVRDLEEQIRQARRNEENES